MITVYLIGFTGLACLIAYLSFWCFQLGNENTRLAGRIKVLELQREEDREKFELLRQCIH